MSRQSGPAGQPEPEWFWQQGDVLLDVKDLRFLYWADLSNPITPAAVQAQEGSEGGLDGIAEDVAGFVVVSQTCDLQRDVAKRPYVELAVLVAVDAIQHKEIEKLQQPRYVAIPGVSDARLVADLDRIMTVEWSALKNLRVKSGFSDNRERRIFARALARKRGRAALPNDFVAGFSPVAKHLTKVAKKPGVETTHIDAVTELRVRAEPDWTAEKPNVTVYVIKEREKTGVNYDWPTTLEKWEKLFNNTGAFGDVSFMGVYLNQLTAAEYVDSEVIDTDAMSAPNES